MDEMCLETGCGVHLGAGSGLSHTWETVWYSGQSTGGRSVWEARLQCVLAVKVSRVFLCEAIEG